ncbi:hypothetical protein FRB99_001941 [Tulasnella sp. 403]|nr:hypothetical protein FRB99_001941 [Tulasnella sp. 403]
MATLTRTITATELGGSVPKLPHAISVSLPTWQDNIDYEEGAKRVVDSMKTGYPRFFIHRSIQLLSRVCEKKFGVPTERCLLFPSAAVSDACRSYLHRHSPSSVTVRLVQYMICPQSPLETSTVPATTLPSTRLGISEPLIVQSPCRVSDDSVTLHIVFFPADTFALAKSFWQHTGDGISSRMAEKCLEYLGVAPDTPGIHGSVTSAKAAFLVATGTSNVSSRYGRNNPYKGSKVNTKPTATPNTSNCLCAIPATSPLNGISRAPVASEGDDALSPDHAHYLEERYGRNLPMSSYNVAKRALRRRIAGVLLRDSVSPSDPVESLGSAETNVGESWRSIRNVSEDDVYLYPTGMSAIWHAHQLVMASVDKIGRSAGKSVCFGAARELIGPRFPYTDTLKILQKWGPGCHFFGNGLDSDLPALRELLESSSAVTSQAPPILALFCEFPSNPLLRSPNLAELRKLADEFGFVIVVDETIGNFVNVDVLKYADIVVSSLTKVFSGETNVMGGSLVLNPQGHRYDIFRDHLKSTYEDTYWPEDAVYMERNSRDFQRRIDIINRNAETIAEFLRAQSEVHSQTTSAHDAPARRPAIKEVFYPKWVTRENYDACRNKPRERGPLYPRGYGGLLSITFTSERAAQGFFDGLACEKGPSLGTNFTLSCPYTVLAHYNEMDWAASWGVDPRLVRVSVGMEDQEVLLKWFSDAILAAEEAAARA